MDGVNLEFEEGALTAIASEAIKRKTGARALRSIIEQVMMGVMYEVPSSDEIKKVVTLDNLRVPFLTEGKFKILSFRSKDPVFKADPGVVPDDATCEQSGITVVDTGFQHTDMSDRGPDNVKTSIQGVLDKFLETESKLAPVETKKIAVPKPDSVAQVAPPIN